MHTFQNMASPAPTAVDRLNAVFAAHRSIWIMSRDHAKAKMTARKQYVLAAVQVCLDRLGAAVCAASRRKSSRCLDRPASL